jgi:hypothetical protein
MEKTIRIIIDIAILVLMLLLMAYSRIGKATHEWIGIALLGIIILHNLLSRVWHRNLFRSRFAAFKTIGGVLDGLLVFSMTLLLLSGLLMSGYAVPFLAWGTGAGVFRLIHLAASYWCILMMAFHLGFHGNLLKGIVKKIPRQILRTSEVIIFCYGIFVLIKRGFWGYLLLLNRFAFYDFSEPLILFLLDYFAAFCAAALFSYWVQIFGKQIKNTQVKGKI